MKLLTAEIKKKLPKLYATDDTPPEKKPIIVKFFHPLSNWAHYACEGEQLEDGDWKFFGLVHGTEPEMGYFLLSELESVKIKGLPIERDMYFGEHMLSEAMEGRI